MLRRLGLPMIVGVVSWLACSWTIAVAGGPRGYDGPRDTTAEQVDVPEGVRGATVPDDEGDASPDEAGDEPADAPVDAPGDEPSDAPVGEPGDTQVDPPEGPAGNRTPGQPDTSDAGPDVTLPPAHAGKKPPPPWMPRHSIIYRNFTAGRINPLGLVNEFTVGYRLQLVERNTQLWRDSFALFGIHGYLTPAYARIGPTLEVQPLAAINLGVTYDFVGAFGNFSQVTSFASPTDDWGPAAVRRSTRAGLNYGTTGHLVTLSGTLQMKVKNVALRSATRALWADFRLQGGDRVFYDQALDIPMPDRGWTLINETDLVYLFDRGRASGLRIALRHSVTHAFYQRRHFDQAEPTSQPNGPTLRLGPAAGYVFFDRPGARFNRPMVFLLSQWWLRHRWRTGEQRHPAIPYAAVGFQFEGDLWPHRRYPKRNRSERTKRGR